MSAGLRAGLTEVITHSPAPRSTNSKAIAAPGLRSFNSEGLATLNAMLIGGQLRLSTGP